MQQTSSLDKQRPHLPPRHPREAANQAALAAVADISKAIREAVACRMCRETVLDLDTTNKESEPDEEHKPVLKKKALIWIMTRINLP